MSTCWKCGKDLPDGATECEDACGASSGMSHGMGEPLKNFDWKEIDWSKVKTVAEVILILSSLELKVCVGTPVYEKLKPFLKSDTNA